MTVNEKLQEVMDWRGVNQQVLSKRTGIPRSTINSYANGRSAISVEVVYQLAPALEVSAWTLLNGEPLLATPMDLSGREAQLVTDLRGLTVQQRELVDTLVETMKHQNRHD